MSDSERTAEDWRELYKFYVAKHWRLMIAVMEDDARFAQAMYCKLAGMTNAEAAFSMKLKSGRSVSKIRNRLRKKFDITLGDFRTFPQLPRVPATFGAGYLIQEMKNVVNLYE